MKLAREIAEKVGSLRGSTWDEDPGWLALAETIIAAKLKPVREALEELIITCTSSDVMEYGETPDRDAIRSAQSVLAVLSEEVEDEKDTQTED